MSRPESRGLSDEVLDRIRAAMPHLKTRAANLATFSEAARFLTDLRPIQLSGKAAGQVNDEARGRLAALLPALEGLTDWSEPAIKEELDHFCARLGISMGKIGPVLRAVLTAGAPAPDITLVLALLGRNEAFARIRDFAHNVG
jgi:glutamyl-tRNA synthetase